MMRRQKGRQTLWAGRVWPSIAACLLACTAGCARTSASEFGPLQCSNKVDDDGDKLVDCADPDCFMAEMCRVASGTTADAGLVADAGTTKASGDRPPFGRPDAGLADDDGGGLPTDAGLTLPDAATDAGSSPCSHCLPTEACVAETCQVAVVDQTGHFVLRILSAVVPVEDRTTLCYDATASECPPFTVSLLYGVCSCPPDPYVQAALVRNGTQSIIGTTETITDSATPVFVAATFDLRVEPGDVLQFIVKDHDVPPMRDQDLFTCTADLSSLAVGPIACTTKGGPLDSMTLSVQAELLPP